MVLGYEMKSKQKNDKLEFINIYIFDALYKLKIEFISTNFYVSSSRKVCTVRQLKR